MNKLQTSYTNNKQTKLLFLMNEVGTLIHMWLRVSSVLSNVSNFLVLVFRLEAIRVNPLKLLLHLFIVTEYDVSFSALTIQEDLYKNNFFQFVERPSKSNFSFYNNGYKYIRTHKSLNRYIDIRNKNVKSCCRTTSTMI